MEIYETSKNSYKMPKVKCLPLPKLAHNTLCPMQENGTNLLLLPIVIDRFLIRASSLSLNKPGQA